MKEHRTIDKIEDDNMKEHGTIDKIEDDNMKEDNINNTNEIQKEGSPMIIKKTIIVKGMSCGSCEKIIHKQVSRVDGVKHIHVNYSTGKGHVEFDASKTTIDKILEKIEENGYDAAIFDETGNITNNTNSNWFTSSWFGFTTLAVGIILIGYFLLKLYGLVQLPQISQNMSYGLLFIVGLLTGFHCVAMCGGFVVSYTTKNAQEGRSNHMSHVSYGVGKLISYTIIGAIFGLIGSIITFTPLMRGVAGIIAGLFLILFGLNMLNLFPILRKIRLTTPSFLTKWVGEENTNSSPFIIGLLNGLMIACGPLQAIYIMAAGTGSVVEGAKLLFIFGLGTLPVMLGFGYLTSFISSKMANKILKASGVIVLLLGLIMVNRGLALTGSGYDADSLLSSPLFSSSSSSYIPFLNGNSNGNNNGINTDADVGTNNVGATNTGTNADGYQEIKMDVLASGWSPNKFVLKKGVPVKWIINGKEITGCNNAIQVPKLGLSFKIKPGLQTIEFTPDEEGVISFSCWMGMITGKFVVKENIDLADTQSVQKELNTVQVPKGGTCGGSGGGCGCGG